MSELSENAVVTNELWSDFFRKKDSESREKLIHIYMPYAEIIAKHLFSKRIYEDVEYNEYVQLAMTGLLESIDRYQLDSVASFRTFSSKRIKGAIYNGLVKLTEKRDQNSYLYRRTKERIESLNNGKNSDDLFLNISELTINIAIGFLLDDSGIYCDPKNDIVHDNSYESIVIDTLKNDLCEIILHLPPLERQVVEYHYFQQVSFQKISEIVNLTKGRVSQIHKKAILRMQELLEEHNGFDGSF